MTTSISWKKIRQNIETAVTQNTINVLAVSGGADSIFLLELMRRHNLLGTAEHSVRIVHFNHLPGQIMDDGAEQVVRAYCTKENLPLIVGYGDKDTMLAASSFEAEARKQRYAFMLKCITQSQRDDADNGKPFRPGLIVTAHNLSDQVEGIIIGMTRGVPINRVAMATTTHFKRHSVSTYRPLLIVSKAMILRQAIRYGLTGRWEDDVTNLDTKYERNFVRHAVLPLLMTRRNVFKSIPKSVQTPPYIEVVHGTLFDT